MGMKFSIFPIPISKVFFPPPLHFPSIFFLHFFHLQPPSPFLIKIAYLCREKKSLRVRFIITEWWIVLGVLCVYFLRRCSFPFPNFQIPFFPQISISFLLSHFLLLSHFPFFHLFLYFFFHHILFFLYHFLIQLPA